MYRYDEAKGDKAWFRLFCFVLDFYLCFSVQLLCKRNISRNISLCLNVGISKSNMLHAAV